jgi:hypothetical protein
MPTIPWPRAVSFDMTLEYGKKRFSAFQGAIRICQVVLMNLVQPFFVTPASLYPIVALPWNLRNSWKTFLLFFETKDYLWRHKGQSHLLPAWPSSELLKRTANLVESSTQESIYNIDTDKLVLLEAFASKEPLVKIMVAVHLPSLEHSIESERSSSGSLLNEIEFSGVICRNGQCHSNIVFDYEIWFNSMFGKLEHLDELYSDLMTKQFCQREQQLEDLEEQECPNLSDRLKHFVHDLTENFDAARTRLSLSVEERILLYFRPFYFILNEAHHLSEQMLQDCHFLDDA